MNKFKSNIWKVYIFQFLVCMSFIGGVLVPFFLIWGKISFTQIMLLQSWFMIWVVILEIPTGTIADKFGRKTSLIIGVIFLAIAALTYSSYPSFYVFLLGEFFWALGGSLLSGADEALVYDSLKKIKQEKKSKKIFGRIGSLEITALMIAAPIGSFIAATLGLRWTMLLMAIPFFIAFILAFTFKEPEIKIKKKREKKYFKILFNGIKYFAKHRILKILVFDRISIAVLVFFIVWTYQPLLQQLGVAIVYFGFVAMVVTGSQIPVMNNFVRLEKLVGSKKNYLFLTALISGICFMLLGLNNVVFIAIILIGIISGFGISRAVVFQSYMNKYIESENRATVISSTRMIDSFVRAILYPIIGLLVEWSLSYTLVIIGIVIIIVSLFSRVEEEMLID